jgi:leucine dehydrogenase
VRDKSEALFRSFGRAVESFGGRYITAEDVDTEVQDMAQIWLETGHVVGRSEEAGGSGDPSPVTALGVLAGIKTCVNVVFGAPDVKGCRVAIHGVGKVGYRLAELLHRRGAELFLCDVISERAAAAAMAFHGHEVREHDFFALPVDVLSPYALGGVLNDDTIPRIRAPVIAGAANNQLQEGFRHSQALSSRGILYAPDFVIYAGGLINVYSEVEKTPKALALQRAEAIGETLRKVLTMSQVEGIATHEAACCLAEERLAPAEAGEAAR